MKRHLLLILGAVGCCGIWMGASPSNEKILIPKGLPQIRWPEDNSYTPEKAALGKLLFFDKRLSSNGTVSCATCHDIGCGLAEHIPVSIGIDGRRGSRNAPTLVNTVYQKYFFWDGRARSLEEQCKGPLGNVKEMTLEKNIHDAHEQCEQRVRNIKGYKQLFKEVFGNDKCSIDDIAKAVATFERTLLSGNSPYDRYIAGDKTAMTPEQIEGYDVFRTNRCQGCHFPPLFSANEFDNIGVGMDKHPNPDLGRYDVTKNPSDKGAFKVPTLRETSRTYPYMHDGSLKTLEEVVDFYDKGGVPNPNLHNLIRPLNLTPKQKKALVAFLGALNGEGWQHATPPESFPES